MNKTLVVVGTLLTAVGVLVCVGFLIAAGVDYRLTEDQGLAPGATPAGIAHGITAGFWCGIAGALLLAWVAITALSKKTRMRATGASAQ